MKEDEKYVTIANIIRSRGNKGEVAALNRADSLARFEVGKTVDVVLPDRTTQKLTIENAWEHNGRLILKFEGVTSISEAELLRRAEVRVPWEDLGESPVGEYFYNDLIGCRMIEHSSGRELGEIRDIYEPGGTLLFSVIDDSGKELLVPFANDICLEVDTEAKRIQVQLPEGLEELKT
jgi:16S rRNA processing protein RimM